MTSSWPRSKRPSATNPKLARLDAHTIFTDRDLGKSVPRILREAGLRVESYWDHFERDDVADNQWLRYVAERHWVALSHDRNILYDREAVRIHMESNGRLFILRGKTGHAALAETFLLARGAVERLLEREGCFIAKVHLVMGRQNVARADVKVRYTLNSWRSGFIGSDDE